MFDYDFVRRAIFILQLISRATNTTTVTSPTIATIITTATSTAIATSPTIATSTAAATSLSTHIEWGTVCLKNKIYISHVETYIIVSFLCKCPPFSFNHSRAHGVIYTYIYIYYLVITYFICRCHRKGDSYQCFLRNLCNYRWFHTNPYHQEHFC